LSLSAPNNNVSGTRSPKGSSSPIGRPASPTSWEQEVQSSSPKTLNSPRSLNSPVFSNYSKLSRSDSNGTVNSLFSDQPKSAKDDSLAADNSLFSSPVDSLFNSYFQRDDEVVRLRSFEFQKK